MSIQPPPPPPITPRQMNLLRAVTAMAWSDGQLEPDEVRLLIDRFAKLFATSETQQAKLKQELQDYLDQNIPLDELIPLIPNLEDRQIVLKLGYEVIRASARTPDEPKVNPDEEVAYQRLVRLLGLPADMVKAIETEAEREVGGGGLDGLVQRLSRFIKG
ncbi:TerB family tellurite resistance protein [Leptolyngbya sp. FACHB-261]|uniref:TerB family tellurite resistance protein n=1 Tax=Leptolyngbya sp. FACHB-261 TaxID=2692806 RepID=UPI0016880249|nr:TerB family tellurite resistance protein [Leptolyngbya sp. FACHB-261]MBD2099665.1 TerB family tellurite resistance protein [Leptolyngbya sp. FACHB-261]